MSSVRSSLSVVIALLLLLAVAACGFRPLYQKSPEGEAVTQDMAHTRVLNVMPADTRHTRLGQKMQHMLIERLNPDGPAAEPLYSLASGISVRKQLLGLQITEEATLIRLTVSANFILRDQKTGQVLFRGSEQAVSTYNIAASEFATIWEERDASDRAAEIISDAIKLQLGMYFNGQRTARAVP